MVHIYVEGGGDAGSTKAACREGFKTLFEGIPVPATSFRVVASGGRLKAYRNFCDALQRHAGEIVLLLVDSERPVTANASPWTHLSGSPDNWARPAGCNDDQAHLMVQMMEAWFMADIDALARYYGQRFLRNSLPRRYNIEAIPKVQLIQALEHASRNTTKRRYHKTQHSFTILKLIDPAKVRERSAHAERLFMLLQQKAMQ